jgi:hypothetical protein
MALITCTECGKQISDKAATCVQCGAPVDNRPRYNSGPLAGLPHVKPLATLKCPSCNSPAHELMWGDRLEKGVFATMGKSHICYCCGNMW